jgi:hypothetical protein
MDVVEIRVHQRGIKKVTETVKVYYSPGVLVRKKVNEYKVA